MKYPLLIALCITLAACGGSDDNSNKERTQALNELEQNLIKKEEDLNSRESELDSTEDRLDQKEEDLNTLDEELTSLETELSSERTQLDTISQNQIKTQEKLDETAANLLEREKALLANESKLGVLELCLSPESNEICLESPDTSLSTVASERLDSSWWLPKVEAINNEKPAEKSFFS